MVTGNIASIIYLIDLRSNAWKRDTDLINYSKSEFIKPSTDSIKRIYLDLKYNFFGHDYFINPDGSLGYINPKKHGNIKTVNKPKATNIRYTDDLIKDIAKLDKFCKSRNIKTKYITPVEIDGYLKAVDFKNLKSFWYALLKENVGPFQLFYLIDEFSFKNDNDFYIHFKDVAHLNQHSTSRWLHEYIKSGQFYIESEKQLDEYFNDLRHKLQI